MFSVLVCVNYLHESYNTTFTYLAKEYPLSISLYWQNSNPKGLQSKGIFHIYINKIFIGAIERDEFGYWNNLDKRPEYEKSRKRLTLPFELQAYDYQVIGEIIEENLPKWV